MLGPEVKAKAVLAVISALTGGAIHSVATTALDNANTAGRIDALSATVTRIEQRLDALVAAGQLKAGRP